MNTKTINRVSDGPPPPQDCNIWGRFETREEAMRWIEGKTFQCDHCNADMAIDIENTDGLRCVGCGLLFCHSDIHEFLNTPWNEDERAEAIQDE